MPKFNEEIKQFQSMLNDAYKRGFEEGSAYADQKYKEGFAAGKRCSEPTKRAENEANRKLLKYLRRVFTMGADSVPFWVLKDLFPNIKDVYDVVKKCSAEKIIDAFESYDKPIEVGDLVRSTVTDAFYRVQGIDGDKYTLEDERGFKYERSGNELIKAGRRKWR